MATGDIMKMQNEEFVTTSLPSTTYTDLLSDRINFDEEDFLKITKFVQDNLEKWKSVSSEFFPRSKTGLARSLLVERNRRDKSLHVYIVFNRNFDNKQHGAFKKAADIFDLASNSFKKRITMPSSMENMYEIGRMEEYLPQFLHSTNTYRTKGRWTRISIVMDRFDCDMKNLFNKPDLSLKDRIEIAKQIFKEISKFHEKKRVMRDLKPDNFLFRSKNGQIEVIFSDLGHVCPEKTDNMQRLSGDVCYIPPEIAKALIENRFEDLIRYTTSKYDMWALSYILVRLFEKELEINAPVLMQKLRDAWEPIFTFQGEEAKAIIANELLTKENLKIEDANGNSLAALIIALRSQDPQQRPSIEECKSILAEFLN